VKIAIASDHSGFKHKEQIKTVLIEQGHEVKDFGTYSTESCDYPDFIRPAAEAVTAGKFERGIVLCGTGNSGAMVANKVAGIRCAVCWDLRSARFSRENNDANMLSLGEQMTPLQDALEIIEVWLNTPFAGGRHKHRLDKMERR